jgi:hypothetical protein
MRFELFESVGSRWLSKNIYTRTERIMYEHVGNKKKNSILCGALWYRGSILLADILGVVGVVVRKMAVSEILYTWLDSFKLNTPWK